MRILLLIFIFYTFFDCFCQMTPYPNRKPFLKQIGFGYLQFYNFENNLKKDLNLNNHILSNNIMNYSLSLNYDQHYSPIKIPKFIDRISISYELYRLNSNINFENHYFFKEMNNDFINISFSKEIFLTGFYLNDLNTLDVVFFDLLLTLNNGIGVNPKVSYFSLNENELTNTLGKLNLNKNENFKMNHKIGFGVFIQNNFIFIFDIRDKNISRIYINIAPFYGFEVEYFNSSLISNNFNYKFRIGVNILPYYY